MDGATQTRERDEAATGRPDDTDRDRGLAARGGGIEGTRSGVLQTDHGRTIISEAVVAKVAGVAAREVHGVHDMGTGLSRTFGGIRERLSSGSGPSPTRGVRVEVGERQAAVDLDLVVEYGASIPDVAEGVRANVTDRVEDMTGLEVVEVNIVVDDIALGDELAEHEEPRVQ